MKGKSTFTRHEADAIISLIRKKIVADSNEQKRLRDKIRALGFYASDFGVGGGYTENDFIRVVQIIGNSPSYIKTGISAHSVGIEYNKAGNNLKKDSFQPISKPDAKILILGTMPGEKSLSLKQYYGHGGNQFWKIMFACFEETFSGDYSMKVNLLVKNKIALWDVLKHCERDGSSDNNISKEIPNDFNTFYKTHNEVKSVLFNGKNAANFYQQHLGYHDGISFEVLPSTSPANTWTTMEAKLNIWKTTLLKYLY